MNDITTDMNRLGIDCINIRSGGGLTIILELLKRFKPGDFGFSGVKVWCNREVADKIGKVNPVIESHTPAELESNGFSRFSWRLRIFPSLARREIDTLLIPGGLPVVRGVRNVSMSLNLLPFMPEEYRRDFSLRQEVVYALLRHLNYRSLSRADHAVFLNENARQVIYGGRHQKQAVSICPLGVDTRFFRSVPTGRSNEEIRDNPPFRLVYVSTVNGYKHQWNVAEAVADLRKKGIPVTVDFVGGAYPRALARLEAAIERRGGEQSGSRYLGKVPHESLQDVYASADAFVFASTCENMPNICLEAMASGLPIASSDRQPMRSMLEGFGEFFDATKPESIACAIECLHNDETLRTQYARKAVEMAKTYDWDSFYACTMAALRGKSG